MWYKTDPSGYKWDELLTLYRVVDQRERAFREDLFRFTNFYAAVCYAILAVTLSGLMSLLGKGPVLLCLVMGPAMTLCMCFLGFRVTGRIYRRVIEEISVKAKLENALRLDGPIQLVQHLGEKDLWKDEESILPPRHAKRRWKNDDCSKFIDTAAKGGFYRDNRVYFGLIGLFSVLLALAIIGVGLWPVIVK